MSQHRTWSSSADETDEQALERLRKAVRQDSRSPLFVPLADLCRRFHFFDEAIVVCQRGLAQRPMHVAGVLALARAQRDRGDLESASQSYERLLRLAADHAVGHGEAGLVAEHLADLPRAIGHYRKALALGGLESEWGPRLRRALEQAQAQVKQEVEADRLQAFTVTVSHAPAVEQEALELVARLGERVELLHRYQAVFLAALDEEEGVY